MAADGAARIWSVGVDEESELGVWLGGQSSVSVASAADCLVRHRRRASLASCVVLRGDLVAVLSELLLLKEDRAFAKVPVLVVLLAANAQQVAVCTRAGAFYGFREPFSLAHFEAVLNAARCAPASSLAESGSVSPINLPATSQIKEVVLSVRTVSEIEAATKLLAGFCPQPTRQALGISELLLNAVEHGNLEIDGESKARLLEEGGFQREVARRAHEPRFAGREVNVWLRRFADHVELACHDQGPGFDWRRESRSKLEAVAGPCGRGIALARTLAFDSLEYFGRGNIAVARINLERDKALSSAATPEISSWERQALEAQIDRVLEASLEDHFLETAAALAAQAVEAPSAVIASLDGEGQLRISAQFPAPPGTAAAARARGHVGSEPGSLLGRALQVRGTVIENEPHELPWFGRVERSLVTPVTYRGKLIGFLQVVDKASVFGGRDARRLETLARRLGPMLAARISAELAERRSAELERENGRVAEEQEAARHVVASLLGEGCLDAPGIRYLAASKELFNGDLAVAARLPSGGLRWMLGDFVGHGLPAAIGGLPLASVFYATARKGVALREVVSTMNEALRGMLPRGFFCAATLMQLEGRRLSCWNGGMPPAVVRAQRSNRVRELVSRDLPLGAAAAKELTLDIEQVEVERGDRIICFSDGLIETANESGELYGAERAMRVLSEAVAECAFDALVRSVNEFRGSEHRFDDLSMVEVTADLT